MRSNTLDSASVHSFEDLPGLYVHPERLREWLPDLPAEIGQSLLGCSRLVPRLSRLIAQHYQLPSLDRSESVDLAIAMLDLAALQRVSRLSGAIFHGRQLRTQIARTVIAELLSGLDDQAYHLAATYAELAPPLDESQESGSLPTGASILQDGRRCFRAWLNAIPESIAKRVALKFPHDFETDSLPPECKLYGPDIVRAAGKELLGHVHP